MDKIFFTVKCKTNLHVGSGKANYGVVDNLVQRDPTFQYPTIHASSLKGAIKEYCYHNGFENMKTVFGSEKVDGKTNHKETQIGGYKFFDANLLAMPVRCDKKAYIHITCPNILDELCEHLPTDNSLKNELKELIEKVGNRTLAFSEELKGAVVEDYDVIADQTPEIALSDTVDKLFQGYKIVVVNNEEFDRLTNDLHLPVIARNYLENGESKNLWYEQIVPRLSIFWSMCIVPRMKDDLFELLFEKDSLVQIGANGSIGYGYCSFNKLNII